MKKSMFRVKFSDKYVPESCHYGDMLVVAGDIIDAVRVARDNQLDEDAKVVAVTEEHTQLVVAG